MYMVLFLIHHTSSDIGSALAWKNRIVGLIAIENDITMYVCSIFLYLMDYLLNVCIISKFIMKVAYVHKQYMQWKC